MWARWSKTIGDGTRSRIGITSMIFAAGALIWICQPRSLIRLDSGSIISGVVAPAWARLKRIPRTPSACMRLSSSVETLSLTTATMRAVGPNAASASRWQRLSVPYVDGCTSTWRVVPMRFCSAR